MLVKLLQCHDSFIYRVPCMLVHLWYSCTCMILYIIFIHTHLWCNFIFFILQDTFLILPHKIIENWKCRLWIWCKAIGKQQCQEVSWVYQRSVMNLKYVESSCARLEIALSRTKWMSSSIYLCAWRMGICDRRTSLKLSHKSVWGRNGTKSSKRSDFNQSNSDVVRAKARYSTVVFDLATIGYFLEFHDTRFGPKKI